MTHTFFCDIIYPYGLLPLTILIINIIIMPNLDGTGPQGPVSGRGRGRKSGKGRVMGKQSLGGSADCKCPKCGHKEAHARGTPCSETKCPKCKTPIRGTFCR